MTVYRSFADELEKIAFGPGSSALLGTALGAGVGALADKENRARGAFIGGGLGAGAGLGGYYGVRSLRKGGPLSRQMSSLKGQAQETSRTLDSQGRKLDEMKRLVDEDNAAKAAKHRPKGKPRIDLNEGQKQQIRDSIKSKFSDEELQAVQELAQRGGL